MIKNNQSLSIAEVSEYLKKDKEEEAKITKFVKKFTSLSSKEAKELRKKLEEHQLIKLQSEHISKIIDILPEDSTELNKLFVDVDLDEDETKKILETIKEFK